MYELYLKAVDIINLIEEDKIDGAKAKLLFKGIETAMAPLDRILKYEELKAEKLVEGRIVALETFATPKIQQELE